MKMGEIKVRDEIKFIVCPSCKSQVKDTDIIEKRGSLGCIQCLKI